MRQAIFRCLCWAGFHLGQERVSLSETWCFLCERTWVFVVESGHGSWRRVSR